MAGKSMRDSSVLGDSWVVHEEKSAEGRTESTENVPQFGRQNPGADKNHISESAITFAPSIMGPELIMPSIHDDMASKGSWVMPTGRSRQTKPQISPTSSPRKSKNAKVTPLGMPKKGATETGPVKPNKGTRYSSLWLILNIFLLLPILHLLVIPELLYHWPSVCQTAGLSRYYPKTCKYASQDTQTQTQQLAATVSTYSRFENFLNDTYGSLSTHKTVLKATESDLRAILIMLRAIDIDARNEVALEYDSAWAALRQSSREFDGLLSEVRSSVDNLASVRVRALRNLNSGDSKEPASLLDSLLSRLSTRKDGVSFSHEVTRLEQLLEKSLSGLSSRTSPLLEHLLALDNHLTFIKQIITSSRQVRGGPYSKNAFNSIPDVLDALWLALSQSLSRLITSQKDEYYNSEDASVRGLHEISTKLSNLIWKEEPIIEIVRTLDKELRALQKIRAIPA